MLTDIFKFALENFDRDSGAQYIGRIITSKFDDIMKVETTTNGKGL